MASPTPPMQSHLQFPPELWSMTTQNFRHRKSPEELTYLWTTVRRVSRQFKEEIEEIFRNEHLPKTWLHVDSSEPLQHVSAPTGFIDADPLCDTAASFLKPLERLHLYDFECKLNFDKIQPRHPARAVFCFRPDHKGYPRFLETAARRRQMFKKLRDEAESGRLREADNTVPGARKQVFDSPVGMFVVQVRGSVGDCALPALKFNVSGYKLSFEWRDMFDRFFGEQKVAKAALHDALLDQAPTHDIDYLPTWQDPAVFQALISQLDPSVQALAQLDRQTHLRHLRVSQEGITRIERLHNPIQIWTRAMGTELGQARATANRRRLRRQADQEIDLDNDGNINRARIDWEKKTNDAADVKGRAEWFPLARVCDACRKTNRQCERKDVGLTSPSICNSCAETGSPCDNTLACLNICRPHYAPQDYQTSFILFQQQKNKNLLMSQSWSQPFSHDRNHALQDFQMQTILLEQQNKKRILMARQEQYNMDRFSFQPSQHSNDWLRQVSDSGIPNASPGPSPTIPEDQPLLQMQRFEKQPMEAWNGPNAYSGHNNLQDSMPVDPVASLPIATVGAAVQPDQVSQPAASSREISDVLPAPQWGMVPQVLEWWA